MDIQDTRPAMFFKARRRQLLRRYNKIVTMAFVSLYNFREPGQLQAIFQHQTALGESVPTRYVTNALAGRKLVCFDVGASGGISKKFCRHRNECQFVLFEINRDESERLKQAGFMVIDRIVDEHDDCVRDIYLTRKPGCSSVLKPPAGPVLKLYKATSNHFEVVKKTQGRTISLRKACEDLNVDIDYLKLDTQGTELNILKGLGHQRPLFIETEMSTIRLYESQHTFYELGDHLNELGYMMIYLKMFPRRPILTSVRFRKCHGYPAVGMPVHGDVYFVPDWTREEGRALLAGRLREWAALMIINGYIEYLALAMEDVSGEGADEIVDVLATVT